MKNQWIAFYSGIITVKAAGSGIERLINSLTRNGIMVWQVKRHGEQAVTFKIKLTDVKRLRASVRKSGCRIEFLHRAGLPFLLKRSLKNSGFLFGAASFLVILILLSNMVWGIEIKGADPATEYKIRRQLDEMGIRKGKLQFFVKNVEGIQRELSNEVDEITWVGVELKGTTYHFQVVEKNEPDKPELLSPRHLVAKKKAVILDMFVEEGKPVVSVNDHVIPGQLLVSGIIGQDGQTQTVPAKGEIWGETWYKSEVKLPLKSTLQVFGGGEKRKYYFDIGNFSIPVWGFGKPEFSEYEIEENRKDIKFLKWTLPLGFTSRTMRESETVTRIYSNEEAFEVAKDLARKDIKNSLSEDAKIKGEKILHQSVENGKVFIAIHFQIIENIAEGQSIIQGDTE
ncbi:MULTISPECIES: sporulation protein YqfD [Bacillus]|uniref:Sporulation protein YqfD n=1 Tax=Bacillus infantis TaxID=324767 RepID=A0A5D4SSB5_9BACI|nr:MULTISPECIES: sporulation protein YqfD [Bacillus]PLR72674.1 sporulation protein YqfD [Bacillus sp. UMB0728]TYS66267.1 sporulation protein YqfD [Bacillus infantis]